MLNTLSPSSVNFVYGGNNCQPKMPDIILDAFYGAASGAAIVGALPNYITGEHAWRPWGYGGGLVVGGILGASMRVWSGYSC